MKGACWGSSRWEGLSGTSEWRGVVVVVTRGLFGWKVSQVLGRRERIEANHSVGTMNGARWGSSRWEWLSGTSE